MVKIMKRWRSYLLIYVLNEGYSTNLFREKAVPNAIANSWQIWPVLESFRQILFFKFQKVGFICLETQWNWTSVLLKGPSNVWYALIIYRPSNSQKIGKYFWSPGWQIKTGIWKIETSKISQIMEKMCYFGKLSCKCPPIQK